jgi:hypothetical protein
MREGRKEFMMKKETRGSLGMGNELSNECWMGNHVVPGREINDQQIHDTK